MKKIICFPALLLLLTAVYGCKKKVCNCGIKPEEKTYFKIIGKEGVLSASVLEKTKMYYYSPHGFKVPADYESSSFIELAFRGEDAAVREAAIGAIMGVAGVYAEKGIGDFYLEYPDGDIDTFSITVESVSPEQANKERCGCTLPIRTMKFNGKVVMEEDASAAELLGMGQPVYLFRK